MIGTHTHIPTADAMLLPNGTAYQTDAGMCGDYDSVIGMEKSEPLRRFVTGMAKEGSHLPLALLLCVASCRNRRYIRKICIYKTV